MSSARRWPAQAGRGAFDSLEWSLFAEGETGLDTRDPFGNGLDRGGVYLVGHLAGSTKWIFRGGLTGKSGQGSGGRRECVGWIGPGSEVTKIGWVGRPRDRDALMPTFGWDTEDQSGSDEQQLVK